MAATTQHPQYDQITAIMREMKRSAHDLLGEPPITPLISSPHTNAPNASHHLSSPWVTPLNSTFSSPSDLPPAPSVLSHPVSKPSSVTDGSENVLSIVRSYRSPTEFMDGGMVSDHLPPSPDTRARNRSEDVKKRQQPRPSAISDTDMRPRLSLSLKSVPPLEDCAVDAVVKKDQSGLRHPSDKPSSEDPSKKKTYSMRDIEHKHGDRHANRSKGTAHDREPGRHRDKERTLDREHESDEERNLEKERGHNHEGSGRERGQERQPERERGPESDRKQHNRARDRNRARPRDRDTRRDSEDDTAESGRDSERDQTGHRRQDYSRNQDRDRDYNRGRDIIDNGDDNRPRRDEKRDRNHDRNRYSERPRDQVNERERSRNGNRSREQDRDSEYGRKLEADRGNHGCDARSRDREYEQKRNRQQDRLRERLREPPRERTQERDYDSERGADRDYGTPHGREKVEERRSRNQDRDSYDKSHDAVKQRDQHKDHDYRGERGHGQDRKRRAPTKHDSKADAISESESDASSQDSIESDAVIPSTPRVPPSKKRRRSENQPTSKNSRSIARESPSTKAKHSSQDKSSGAGPNESSERTVPRVVLRIPSKHVVNNADKASSSSKSRGRDGDSWEERSERRRSSSNRKKIPSEEASQGTKRRADRELLEDRDGMEKNSGEGRRPSKRTRHDEGRLPSKSTTKKVTTSQGSRLERPLKRSEEAGENAESNRRTDLSKRSDSTARYAEGSSLPKKNGPRGGRVDLRSERSSASRAAAQHPYPQIDQSSRSVDEDMSSDSNHARNQERGRSRDRSDYRNKTRERTREHDRKRDLNKGDRKEVSNKNSNRRKHDVKQPFDGQVIEERDPAREKAPADYGGRKASKKNSDQERDGNRERDVNQNRKTEEGKVENTHGSTVQKNGGSKQEPDKNGKSDDGGEKRKHVLGIRSKPISFAQTGQGVVPASSEISPTRSAKPGGVQNSGANGSPDKRVGTSNRQVVGSSAMSAQSQQDRRASVKAKGLEMYDLYKKAKERCTKSLAQKEYDLYEIAAKDCVRYYFEWALTVETELRLCEAEMRHGNGAELVNRRKHVTGVYRHMTNYLIPQRIRELEGINRHQSTHHFSRLRQKVYMRIFYIQRVWNRVVKSGSDTLCKTVADVCRGKQAGDKVELTLEYKQMSEIKEILLQYQNNINIAEQIVSDNGDGHEDAGGECTIC